MEKVSALETQAFSSTASRCIVLERRLQRRQVEADGTHVRMHQCHLNRQAALRRSDVAERRVILPWKLPRYPLSRQHAAGRHSSSESPQSHGVGVKQPEMILPIGFSARIAGL